MSPIVKQVLSANDQYVRTFGDKDKLPMPPARHFAILTCMDARLDPAKYSGLSEGDAHVVRNAGGRVTEDAIRSLVISHKLLGTNEWFVVHHSNCGMETFTDGVMRGLLEKSLDTAVLNDAGWRDVGKTPGSGEGEFIDWLAIDDQERSILRDVRRLRAHPLVPGYIAIHGYLYDVTTGRLREVAAATGAGQRTSQRHSAGKARPSK